MQNKTIFVNEIIRKNMLNEETILSQSACKSSEGIRLLSETGSVPDSENIRPTFFHDTDRIIHSLAYSRYIDKTQVFFLFLNNHITHRVLHVQFVSKIARVIGRCLNLNEDLIEAIALGHDIGHTPYGHDGERYLDEICRMNNWGYFCHNAQSVRFLMELEKKGNGLNLTLQVLDGILCHNGELVESEYCPDKSKTWDKFLDQYNNCWVEEEFVKKIRPMTFEGCVVRICDIIGYIGRDIEDAIEVNLIKRCDIPEDIVAVLGDSNDKIINSLVVDLINNSYGKPYLSFSKNVFEAIIKMKKFSSKNIYQNPKLRSQDSKIKTMFFGLFDKFMNDLSQNNQNSSIYNYVNEMDKKYLQNTEPYRIVLDYISGMTDEYFNSEFRDAVMPKSFGMKF